MSIKTLDTDALVNATGNLFSSVAVLAKRSRQVASQLKSELDEQLAYYEGFEFDDDDTKFREEQARVSLKHELRPEPTELAIEELMRDVIYYRDPAEDND